MSQVAVRQLLVIIRSAALLLLSAVAARGQGAKQSDALLVRGAVREMLMAVGETRLLYGLATPAMEKNAPTSESRYASSNEAVVTIGPDGVMRARSEGHAVVTATVPGLGSELVTRAVNVRVLRRRGQLIGSTAIASRPFGVAVRQDGLTLVGRQDADALARIRLPALAVSGSPIKVGRDPGDVAFSADGCRAYVTNVLGSSVSVVDVATGTELGRFKIAGSPLRVLPSPDGTRMYVTSSAGVVTVISTVADSVLQSISVGGFLNGIAAHPDRRVVYLSSTDGALIELDLELRGTAVLARGLGHLQDIALSPDARTLYAADERGRLHAIDLQRRTVETVNLPGGAFGLRLNPGGDLLYVSLPGAGRVLLLARASLAIVADLEVGGTPRRIGFSPDGSFAIVANEYDHVDFLF